MPTTDQARVVSFTIASALAFPFIVVLLAVGAVVLGPTTPPVTLGAIVLYGYSYIPTLWGMSLLAAAVVAIAISFRTSQGARLFVYPLVTYAVVILACVAYVTWWHATGQRWDSL